MKYLTHLSLILIVLVIVCTTFSACKQIERQYSTKIDETDVARLTLFSYDGKGEVGWGLTSLGHAYIGLENISGSELKILNKTIGVDENITIGTWSILEHFGVWYNIESNYTAEYNKYDGRLSITIGISLEDIDKIADYISKNDNWNPLDNCSNFAMNLWNTVASEDERIENPLIYTPKYLCEEMKKFDSYEYNKVINTSTETGFFEGSEYVSFVFEEGSYESV